MAGSKDPAVFVFLGESPSETLSERALQVRDGCDSDSLLLRSDIRVGEALMSTAAENFYDEAALLERLTTGVQRSAQPVIFLVGSGLTSPITEACAGVPGVRGVIDLIKAEFDPPQQIELERQICETANAYQAAFSFLLGRRGQQAANRIIRQAVWQARSAVSTKLANSFSLGGNPPKIR